MNWKNLVAASFFAILNVAALSAHADTQTASQRINHGIHLDFKKVISIVDNDNGSCGIIDARMTYLDSNDVQKVLDYRKFAECANQGN
ncbi:DUF2790 domain-containing protein [Pseudomonas sp. GB2N2]